MAMVRETISILRGGSMKYFILLSVLSTVAFARPQYQLRCGSDNYQLRQCPAPTQIRQAQLLSIHSSAACDYGRTWGFDRHMIWVDRGCRATFLVTPYSQLMVKNVHCASNQYQYNTCYAGGQIERANILSQTSSSPCQYGRTWGYGGNRIWVDRGCKATFQVSIYTDNLDDIE
jgi:hypothetical protein